MSLEINAKRIALVLGIIGLNIWLDQGTKAWARNELMGAGELSYLGGFFRFVYAENKGAFLSLGGGLSEQIRYWSLKVLPVLLLVGLLGYTLFSAKLDRAAILSFSLILGGGISNVYDRIRYNQVTDFMNMGFPDLRTGIFNFADVAIMLGLGVMLLGLFKQTTTQGR